MAPSKGRKPKTCILNDWLESLPSASSGLESNDDLNLKRAYGLLPPTELFATDKLFLRDCDNMYSDQPRASTSKSSPAARQETPDSVVVVVVSASGSASARSSSPTESKDSIINDTDDEIVITKQSGKGKGKAKDDGVVKCKAAKCSSNPKCVNFLGQDKWEDYDKAFEAFKKAKKVESSAQLERQPGLPVGLRNLGATCYVNSFLQVWFQDETFRRAVYACDPPSDGKVDASPLFQLQVLFAFLQRGHLASYDPEPLVTSLKLDRTEQQDAQEFSKLFMDRLDYEFKAQGQRDQANGVNSEQPLDVAKLVETQFEGSMIYGTECGSCGRRTSNTSLFRELEISLAKDCRLEDRIKESLKDEWLVGDNQYFCENCQCKRDAKRYTELQSLPPVLHFSLLRFVFSMKTMTRKKATEAISYPMRINMGKHLPKDAAGHRPEVWYQLKGVLMHKGTSAHHGHYVAEVHDSRRDKWYLFDDETVRGIDALNTDSDSEEEEEKQEDSQEEQDEDQQSTKGRKTKPSVKKKPAPAPKAKAKPKAKGKGKAKAATMAGFLNVKPSDLHRPRSKDAYMLVYTLERDGQADQGREPEPPPLAQFRVEDMKRDYDKEQAKETLKEQELKTQFEALRDEKRSVYTVWKAHDHEEDTFLVSKDALAQWMERGWPVQPTKFRLTVKSANVESKTNGEVDRTDQDNKPGKEQTETSKMDVDKPVETNGHVTGDPNGVVEAAPTQSPEDDPMDADEPATESAAVIDSVDCMCQHGLADPRKADQLKRISKDGVEALRQLKVDIKPIFRVPDALCHFCARDMLKDKAYAENHAEHLQEFAKADKSKEKDFAISKTWFLDWQRASPSKIHKAGENEDESPALWNHEVLCPHGALVPGSKTKVYITEKGASFLQNLFPDWSPPDADLEHCERCRSDLDKVGVQKKAMSDQVKKEKHKLRNLQQSVLGGVIRRGEPHYAVSRVWSNAWRLWTEKKGERPGPVDNSAFLCEHGLLVADMEQARNNRGELVLIDQDEWIFIAEEYGGGPVISCTVQAGKIAVLDCFPAVCKPCIETRRKEFDEAEIWIQPISNDDLDESGKRKITKDDMMINDDSDDECMILQQTKTSKTGNSKPVKVGATPRQQAMLVATRQSSRLASSTSQSAGAKRRRALPARKSMFVNKPDTVKAIKVCLAELYNTPTIYQRLFFKGRELDDSSETVEHIGICPGDTIEMLKVDAHDDDVDFGALSDADEDSIAKGRGKKRRTNVEGFSGTGLYGWEQHQQTNHETSNGTKADGVSSGSGSGSKGKSDTSQREQKQDDGAAGQDMFPCPHCTFLQAMPTDAETECEVCGLVMLS